MGRWLGSGNAVQIPDTAANNVEEQSAAQPGHLSVCVSMCMLYKGVYTCAPAAAAAAAINKSQDPAQILLILAQFRA